VTIGGEFSKFKRYTINYLREMAVITPYARFEMHYTAEGIRCKLIAGLFCHQSQGSFTLHNQLHTSNGRHHAVFWF